MTSYNWSIQVCGHNPQTIVYDNCESCANCTNPSYYLHQLCNKLVCGKCFGEFNEYYLLGSVRGTDRYVKIIDFGQCYANRLNDIRDAIDMNFYMEDKGITAACGERELTGDNLELSMYPIIFNDERIIDKLYTLYQQFGQQRVRPVVIEDNKIRDGINRFNDKTIVRFDSLHVVNKQLDKSIYSIGLYSLINYLTG